MFESNNPINIFRVKNVPCVYTLVDNHIANVKVYRGNPVNVISENFYYKYINGKEEIKQNLQVFNIDYDFISVSNAKVELELKFKNFVIKETFWMVYDVDASYDILLSLSTQRKYSLYISYDDSLCMKSKNIIPCQHVTISVPSDTYSKKEFMDWLNTKDIDENYDMIELRTNEQYIRSEISNEKCCINFTNIKHKIENDTTNIEEKIKQNIDDSSKKNKNNKTIEPLNVSNVSSNINVNNNNSSEDINKNILKLTKKRRKRKPISDDKKLNQFNYNYKSNQKDKSYNKNVDRINDFNVFYIKKRKSYSLKLIGNYKTTRHYFEILSKFKKILIYNSFSLVSLNSLF